MILDSSGNPVDTPTAPLSELTPKPYKAPRRSNRDFRLANEASEEPEQAHQGSKILDSEGNSIESKPLNSESKTLQLSDNLTPDQHAFLVAFVETATLTHAAEASRVDRSRHYDWVRDPVYARAFMAAKEAAADRLEGEARRRAVEGVERAVGWFQGEPGGYERVYSDTLLVTLLKAWLPDRYKDRAEVINLQDIDVTRLTPAVLEKITAALIAKAEADGVQNAQATVDHLAQLEAGVVVDAVSEPVEPEQPKPQVVSYKDYAAGQPKP